MSDVNCPYCKADQEICHDDGYGYEDGGEFEQDCGDCGKTFKYTTQISFYYKAYCQDDDHYIESWAPAHPRMVGCTKCEYTRLLKDGEQPQVPEGKS